MLTERKLYTKYTWEARVRGFFNGFARGCIEPWVHAKETETGGFKLHSRENDMTIVGTKGSDTLKILSGWNGSHYNHNYAVRMS